MVPASDRCDGWKLNSGDMLDMADAGGGAVRFSYDPDRRGWGNMGVAVSIPDDAIGFSWKEKTLSAAPAAPDPAARIVVLQCTAEEPYVFKLLMEAGMRARLATSVDAADPGQLSCTNADLVVIPCSPFFPSAAQRLGARVAHGGLPVGRSVCRCREIREERRGAACDRRLQVRRGSQTDAPGAPGGTWHDG